MFRGAITALITPFKNGALDEAALQSLVDWQITEGIDGLVPVGTTGESPTLSHIEHERVVEVVVEAAAKRVPIIAGAGSNSTAEAISFTQHAEKAGADAVLHVTPYYNKPTQDGLFAHFAAIAENTALPIILYNIPGRSIVDMTPETMGRLAEIENIVGVKDATADMARVGQQAETCGPDFIQLSGEDASAVDFNRAGGVGVISVCANIAPAKCAAVQKATLAAILTKPRRCWPNFCRSWMRCFAKPAHHRSNMPWRGLASARGNSSAAFARLRPCARAN